MSPSLPLGLRALMAGVFALAFLLAADVPVMKRLALTLPRQTFAGAEGITG